MKRKPFVSADELSELKFYQYVTPSRNRKEYDVIIVGGSYAGFAASIILARALKQVLIIDSGNPCYLQNSYAHNSISQDGETLLSIAAKAKEKVLKYRNVKFLKDLVRSVIKDDEKFTVETKRNEKFFSKKILFTTGVADIMPGIPGFKECWGISVLHCANCHGYEISNTDIGIIANGENAYEMVKLISNWTKRLTVFTNGKPAFNDEQKAKIGQKNIEINDLEIESLEHINGQINSIIFRNKYAFTLDAIFTMVPFVQATNIPTEGLGCKLTNEGLIEVDALQKTSVYGVYSAGDNSGKERSISAATASGATAGASINNEITNEQF